MTFDDQQSASGSIKLEQTNGNIQKTMLLTGVAAALAGQLGNFAGLDPMVSLAVSVVAGGAIGFGTSMLAKARVESLGSQLTRLTSKIVNMNSNSENVDMSEEGYDDEIRPLVNAVIQSQARNNIVSSMAQAREEETVAVNKSPNVDAKMMQYRISLGK